MNQAKYDRVVKAIQNGEEFKPIIEKLNITMHDLEKIRLKSYKLQYEMVKWVKHRYCSSCRDLKPYDKDNFRPRSKWWILLGVCIKCYKTKKRVDYIDNKETLLKLSKEYYQTEAGKESRRKGRLKQQQKMIDDPEYNKKRTKQNRIGAYKLRKKGAEEKVLDRITKAREQLNINKEQWL